MNLPVFIASRYLLSKKSFNIINIISLISFIGVVTGTLALIVILSVFNGFEDLVSKLYNTFDADIKITSSTSKYFDPASIPSEKLKSLKGLVSYSEVIEGNVLLRNGNEQYVATLKGVSEGFFHNNPMAESILKGKLELSEPNSLITGLYIAYKLGIAYENNMAPSIDVFAPNRKSKSNFQDLTSSFIRQTAVPSGIFSIQQDIDSKYVISGIDFARTLFSREKEVSAIELRFDGNTGIVQVQKQIEKILPPGFQVKNHYQQQEVLYKVMNMEKWFIFFILVFILIIAIFNLVSSQTMLILDKIRDVSFLHSLGMSVKDIRKIFIYEGMMIVIAGEITGLILGVLLCYLQQEYGLIRLGNGSGAFLVEYYPVKLEWLDVAGSLAVVTLTGWLASLVPAMRIKKHFLKEVLMENIRSR